ncbi:MAG: hypothetical protein NBV67_13010 [Tagaea sp.]|nr:hypothetical protein [Tagaea sp.]
METQIGTGAPNGEPGAGSSKVAVSRSGPATAPKRVEICHRRVGNDFFFTVSQMPGFNYYCSDLTDAFLSLPVRIAELASVQYRLEKPVIYTLDVEYLEFERIVGHRNADCPALTATKLG